MPAKDVVISGSFIINKYLVTFKIDGEVLASDSLEYGATIVAPEVPEREGYVFEWTDEVPDIVPAEDVVINGSYVSTEISNVTVKDEVLCVYTVDGRRVSGLQQGFNVVLMRDGSIRKIFVK